MTKGICIVATGDYTALALDCLKHTTRNTDLPIHIFHTGENRDIKTRLFELSPFDRTIFLDADSIILSSGIDLMISMLDYSDIVLNPYIEWNEKTKQIYRLYHVCMKQFGCKLPMTVYSGALFSFVKNKATENFFNTWNRYWKEFGGEREMPPLACAVQHCKMNIAKLPPRYFAASEYDSQAVVQHWYEGFQQRFKTGPKIKPVFKQDVEHSWQFVNVN